jgi:hypothetical protein
VIVGAVFGLKLWRPETWELSRAILVALAAGVLAYLGLIWVMRFNISKRALLRVLPQASIFVFGAILFLILFFFGEFERIYESLIFIVFLLGFVVLLTMVFLTANILSVAAVKKIPLFRVGQTASYAITLFAAFFITASFVSSGLDLLILLSVLGIMYWLLIGLHLSHFPVGDKYLFWYAISIAWAALMALMAFLVWPISGLLVSFVPVTIIYSGLGMVMYHIEGLEKARMRQIIFEFLLFALISLVAIVFQARWGIGGAFWM